MIEQGNGFGTNKKRQIKNEQAGRCAICGVESHLTIHHILPRAHGGTNAKLNGLGVCREPCHDVLDIYAKRNKYYPEVLMEKGFWHQISKRRKKLKKAA